MAVIFMLGLGFVIYAFASSCLENSAQNKKNEEYKRHNYTDSILQNGLVTGCCVRQNPGGYNIGKITRAIMHKSGMNYGKAEVIAAELLTKHFLEEEGFEYNQNWSHHVFVKGYDLKRYEHLICEENRPDDYDRLLDAQKKPHLYAGGHYLNIRYKSQDLSYPYDEISNWRWNVR